MKESNGMERHLNLLRLFIVAILLSFAGGVNAASSTTDAFLERVQKDFIRNTLAGTWEAVCTISADRSSSYSAIYEFTDTAIATLTTYQFADSLCISVTESTKIEGSLSLQGLTFDKFGRYVYTMSVVTSAEETYPLSLSLELKNSLIVHQSDTAAQTMRMSPMHQGENQ
jgi:hypothetical protein